MLRGPRTPDGELHPADLDEGLGRRAEARQDAQLRARLGVPDDGAALRRNAAFGRQAGRHGEVRKQTH